MYTFQEIFPREIIDLFIQNIRGIQNLISFCLTSKSIYKLCAKYLEDHKMKIFQNNKKYRKGLISLFSKDFPKHITRFVESNRNTFPNCISQIRYPLFEVKQLNVKRNYITLFDKKVFDPCNPDNIVHNLMIEISNVLERIMHEINNDYLDILTQPIGIYPRDSRRARGARRLSKLKRTFILKCIFRADEDVSTPSIAWWNKMDDKSKITFSEFEQIFARNGKFNSIFRSFLHRVFMAKTTPQVRFYSTFIVNGHVFVKLDDKLVELSQLIRMIREEIKDLIDYGFGTKLYNNVIQIKTNEVDVYTATRSK